MLLGLAGVAAGCREASQRSAARRTSQALPTRDVVYVEGSAHPKHRLDIYAPKHGPAPYVLFVHGGYWVSGDRRGGGHGPGLYASIGNALAARGVGCIIPSYRLAPEANIVDMVADVSAAAAWSIAHVGEHAGDRARVFMMGHSAGGHLVALMAADPKRRPRDVRGYIPLSAIWDVADMHDRHDASFNESVTYPVFGEGEDGRRRHSPFPYLDAHTPPLLIAVGSEDFPYMIPQARRAHTRLAAAGHPATLHVVEGNTHMDMVRRFGATDDNMTARVVAFVNGP